VKVGVIVLAIGVIAVVGAIAFYMLAMPGRLAADYKEDAEPAQKELRSAMRPVFRTLSPETFGFDARSVRKAKTPDQYVRAIDKATSSSLRRLEPAHTAIRRAKRVLEDADEEALYETPDWPLLGGRGDLEDAEAIAEDERRYVSEARAFLKHYDRLLSYTLDMANFVKGFGVAFGRGFASIPDRPTSPGQVTGPLGRTVSRLDREMRTLRRLKAPPELRADHKTQVAFVRFVIRQIDSLSSAVKARDLQRIEAWDNEFARGTRRYDTTVSLRRLVKRSSYAKSVRKLRGTERRLLRGFERL
jgi:hypothetical protein